MTSQYDDLRLYGKIIPDRIEPAGITLAQRNALTGLVIGTRIYQTTAPAGWYTYNGEFSIKGSWSQDASDLFSSNAAGLAPGTGVQNPTGTRFLADDGQWKATSGGAPAPIAEPDPAALNSTYPDNTSYYAVATSANWPQLGILTGSRIGTTHTQRVQATIDGSTYVRSWRQTQNAWTAWYAQPSAGDFTARGQIFAASNAGTHYVVQPGQDGQVLTADYTKNGGVYWATPAAAAAASGTLIGVRILTAGTTSYTPTAGTTRIFMRVIGGGGAGGGAVGTNTTGGAGAGGGGGAYLEKTVAVSAATTYVCQVGNGGVPGAAGANAGGAGQFSKITIAGVDYTAFGNTGGAGMAAGSTLAISQAPGGGIAATNGDVNASGSVGTNGIRFSGTIGAAGHGANSPLGGGGQGYINGSNSPGQPGLGYGSGGAGALIMGSAGSFAGGAGAPGVIIIHEYR